MSFFEGTLEIDLMGHQQENDLLGAPNFGPRRSYGCASKKRTLKLLGVPVAPLQKARQGYHPPFIRGGGTWKNAT